MDKLVRAFHVVGDYSDESEEQSLVKGYTVYLPASTNTSNGNFAYLEQRPSRRKKLPLWL